MQWIWYSIAAAVLVCIVVFLFVWLKERHKHKRAEKIITNIQKAGLEERVKNFITRFGRGENTKNAWEYRNNKIDWNRINEAIDYFAQKGVTLTPEDFNVLLRHYIDKKEKNITLGSFENTMQDFKTLSGSDFERLLQRLYDKMGYSTQLIGKVGDQGGDLVVTKAQDRLLIQAKCYKNIQVGNDAVQQAFAAKTYYDCNKAAVITTSDFTRAAVELARVNYVELIPKKRLQQLLLEHLSESWN